MTDRKTVLALCAIACLMPAASRAQDVPPIAVQTAPGVAPAGRQAVLSGQITDIDRDSLTINYFGGEMNVDASALLGTNGDLDDFYEEGMMVTVRGTLTAEDQVAASSITEISSPGPALYGETQ